MTFILSLVSLLVVIATILATPVLTKKLTGIKIYLRFAILGVFVFMFLINGLSQIIYSSVINLFPDSSFLFATFIAILIQSVLAILGYIIAYTMMNKGKIEIESCFSIAYGVSVLSIVTVFFSTAVSNTYVYFHLNDGSLAEYLLTNFDQETVTQLVKYYTTAPIAYILLIPITCIAIVFVQYAVASILYRFKNFKMNVCLPIAFIGIFVFNFCYQYLPTVSHLLTIIIMLLFIVASVVACIAFIDQKVEVPNE